MIGLSVHKNETYDSFSHARDLERETNTENGNADHFKKKTL